MDERAEHEDRGANVHDEKDASSQGSLGRSPRGIDPRLRVLYLLAVASGAFLVRDARVGLGLVAVHAIAWLALRLGARALARQVVKLWGFAAFVTASYALTTEDPTVNRWVRLDLGFATLPINVGGALVGGLMVLRVLAVVLASRIARAGDERAIALGLRKLGAPRVIAAPIDAVLALLGGGGGGRGRGGGGGGGRGRRAANAPGDGPQEGFLASLGRIARGDVGPIVDRMDRHIERAERYLSQKDAEGDLRPDEDVAARRRDVTIIAGIALTMLGIKALKLLPNIPFAPGHKLVLLTPLYVVASLKTRTRFGATLTGLVMGSVAFLLGDGRYGVFEIAKHVAPGILCDLLVPLVAPRGRRAHRRPRRRRADALVWSIVGGVMGVGRFATIFTVTLTVQAPAVAWALLVPGLLIHTTFGALSGLVSSPLIRAVLDREEGARPEHEHEHEHDHGAASTEAAPDMEAQST